MFSIAIEQSPWYSDYLKKSKAEDLSLIDQRSLPMLECKQLDRIRLAYLTTVQAPSAKTPLNLEAEKACTYGQRQRKIVKWSIIAGLFATILIFAPLNYLALQNNIIATATAMMIQTIVSSSFSYYATGIAPYIASNRDNETQNEMHRIEEIYRQLGGKLLKLYYRNQNDRSFAVEISKRLDLNELSRKIHSKTHSQALTDSILSPLKAVTAHIERESCLKPLKHDVWLYDLAKRLKKKHKKNSLNPLH